MAFANKDSDDGTKHDLFFNTNIYIESTDYNTLTITHSIPEINELCGLKTGLLKNDQSCFLIKMYSLDKEKEKWLT